jgi:hypothetical protein
MPKLESATIDSCTVYHLPGRDWFYLLGPQNSNAKNLVFGLAEFPAGTLAAAHVHAADEPEPLRLVTLFSPPVVPGAYDPNR